jgi:hypothetical protein
MQVLQHPWMSKATPPPRVDELEEQLKLFVGGKLKPDDTTLLGQMFALKPGTDKMLLEEHNT